jgi:murein hydrolase activator
MLLRCFFALCLSFSLLAHSEIASAASTYKKLKEIVAKIESVKSDLTQTQKQQTEVQKQLKVTEASIGQVRSVSHETAKKITQEQSTLKVLRNKQSDYQERLSLEQQSLSEAVRSAYILGDDGYLKIFLNQEDIGFVSRMQVYYQYLFKARQESMTNASHTLLKLKQTDKVVQKQTKVLVSLHNKQQVQQKQLEAVHQEKSQVLSKLSSNLKTKQEQLKKLLADKAALENLITRLSAQKRAPVVAGSLKKLQGKLLSPTSGQVVNAFDNGAVTVESRLNGVVVAAPEGQEVHAIAEGRVIFADLLQGYGLLLIVDHGHGYMSLYGRNKNLYKKVGSHVAAGELIASVGNSGGYEKTGLYFAMRYNGKPIDPTLWCKM